MYANAAKASKTHAQTSSYAGGAKVQVNRQREPSVVVLGPPHVSAGRDSSSASTAQRVWEVTWAGPTSKKNIVWANDGFLTFTGSYACLYHDVDGPLKKVCMGPLASAPQSDDELKLSGNHIRITGEIDYSSFVPRLLGISTNTGHSPAVQHRAPAHSVVQLKRALPATAVAQQQTLAQHRASQPFKMPAPNRNAVSVKEPLGAVGGGLSIEKPRDRDPSVEVFSGVENRRPVEPSPLSSPIVNKGKSKTKGQHYDDDTEECNDTDAVTVSARKRPRLVLESDDEEDARRVREPVKAVAGPSHVRSPPKPPPRALPPAKNPGSSEKPDNSVEMMELDGNSHVDEPRDQSPDEVQVIESVKQRFQPAVQIATAVINGQSANDEAHYYLCQWRKYSNKKNASWEGDAVLVIRGKKATLQDVATGKEIAVSMNNRGARLESGAAASVGQKVCQVERVLSEAEYLDGSIFQSDKPKAQPVAKLQPVVSSASFFAPPSLVQPRAFFDRVAGGGPQVKNSTPAPRFDPDQEGAVVLKRPSKAHESVFNKKNLPIVDVVIDPLLSDKLHEHQKDGVKFLYECVMGMRSESQGCILADDMGLGKTIQAVTLIWTLMKQNPYWGLGVGVIERCAIVCPVSLIHNWQSEIKKWLGKDRLRVLVAETNASVKTFVTGRNYQVLIIGYDRLRSCVEQIKSCQPPIGLLICDEGHTLKSASTKTTKALHGINCKRRVILSGTPIQNNLSEYHTMVDFVSPGLLDTYSNFKKYFEKDIVRSRESEATATEKARGRKKADQMYRINEKFILRRTNEVIARYLPPKLEYTVFIVPTELELDVYETILRGDAVQTLVTSGAHGASALSVMTVLRKLCNTPGLLIRDTAKPVSKDVLQGDVLDALQKCGDDLYDFALSGKMQVLGSLLAVLRKPQKEKIVIVSNFTQTLDFVEKHCKKMKYPCRRLDGTTDAKDRVPMVDAFNRGNVKDHFIFLLSSKSGGTGLNIIGASRLVMLDGDWNPKRDAQAMARIHRQGQKKPCVIYRFLSAGTMDEKIYQRQLAKSDLGDLIMDKDKDGIAGGATKSGKGGEGFSLQELRDIFKLHRGVASQTHDLLGCRCHFGENQADAAGSTQGDSSDDESQDMQVGFTQASQYHPREEQPNKRKQLSMLIDWKHHNCSDRESVDEIEDELLRAVVYQRVVEASEDEPGYTPAGRGGARLRGGQIGMAFALSSTAQEDQEEVDAQEDEDD